MFDNWYAWLDGAVGSLAKKVLSALGIGWVSFTGISELAGQIKDYVGAAYGGIPADCMAIISMSGFGVALGVILGALTYKATLASFSYLGKLIV